jgi:hypothetical protein
MSNSIMPGRSCDGTCSLARHDPIAGVLAAGDPERRPAPVGDKLLATTVPVRFIDRR